MCGIGDSYRFGSGQPADELLVREMADDLRHRGPDDDGFCFGGLLGFGMRRLSIIDRQGGAQRIASESGSMASHVVDVLLSSGSACTMYFEPATVKGMIEDHVSGRQDYKRALLSLLVFELWHDQFIRPSGARFRDALHASAAAAQGAEA